MKEKKALKKSGDTPQEAESTKNNDHRQTESKSKQLQHTGKKAAPSHARQTVHRSSAHETPVTQQNSMVQSNAAAFDQHGQGHFVPPMGSGFYPPPPQSFHHSLPHPPQQYVPPPQPYLPPLQLYIPPSQMFKQGNFQTAALAVLEQTNVVRWRFKQGNFQIAALAVLEHGVSVTLVHWLGLKKMQGLVANAGNYQFKNTTVKAMGNIACARSPLGTFPVDSTSLSHSLTTVGDNMAHSAVPHSPSSGDSINEPITTGIHRQRTYSAAGHDDPTILMPSRMKWLKIYAEKAAENDVSEKGLNDFIDTGGIYYMLIDLKVCMMKFDVAQRAAILLDLKELINSKDFKSALQNRLIACLLSPNITAYMEDTLPHIMNFIKNNSGIFKVPLSLFKDVKLTAILAKTVSELLSSIRGNMKSKLLASICKRMSITDTAKSLAHGSIEVDSAHWNRLAFLRRCLRVFMIGISNYRTIPLKALYSPSLIPSLHTAVRARIGPKLSIDINGIEDEMLGREEEISDNQDDEGLEMHNAGAPSGDSSKTDGAEGLEENSGNDGDADQDNEPEDNEVPDTTPHNRVIAEDDSGFGDNGKPAIFTSGRFWNFVDTSLKNIHKVAKQEAADNQTTLETAFRQMLVEYFQEDLADFPSKMTIPRLLTNSSPQWQTTIQNNLLWTDNK
ncbi:uncharacterized protein EDB91DRAFT_1251337 [Suillus paluster]|uniref:uncharacterized protein n=1 Tax=Suillus paluster TaxID=48578 RepID=UPI001B85BEA7|nr:uncharacterized protein EDB91DRAFT_1251337 [Suillus paluster]KAG1733334.1 hypothetical protein EDB91DRAFT_1251337 [Suillus paluster]